MLNLSNYENSIKIQSVINLHILLTIKGIFITTEKKLIQFFSSIHYKNNPILSSEHYKIGLFFLTLHYKINLYGKFIRQAY